MRNANGASGREGLGHPAHRDAPCLGFARAAELTPCLFIRLETRETTKGRLGRGQAGSAVEGKLACCANLPRSWRNGAEGKPPNAETGPTSETLGTFLKLSQRNVPRGQEHAAALGDEGTGLGGDRARPREGLGPEGSPLLLSGARCHGCCKGLLLKL